MNKTHQLQREPPLGPDTCTNVLFDIPVPPPVNPNNDDIDIIFTVFVDTVAGTYYRLRIENGSDINSIHTMTSNPANPPTLISGKPDCTAAYSDFVVDFDASNIGTLPDFSNMSVTINGP